MFPGSKSLMSEWPNYKTKILNLARTRTPSVVNEATDDADDGELFSFMFTTKLLHLFTEIIYSQHQ
jgi:hypothetical protein